MKKTLLSLFVISSFSSFSQWVTTNNNSAQDCISAFGKVFATDVFANGLDVSTDNGGTWSASNTGIPTGGVNFGTLSGSNLYAYNNNTVFTTTTGNNWSSMASSMSTSLIIKSMTSINGSVIASASPNSPVSFKIFQLNGSNWALKSSPTNSAIVRCIRNLNGTLFAGTTNSSVIKSTDGGMTFSGSSTGMPTENINKYINCFGATSTALFAGTMGGKICRSTDNGATWSTVYNIGDNNGFYGINDIYIYSNNDIFCATDSGFVYSTNGGTTWQRKNNGLNFSNFENLMTKVTVSGNYIVASVKTSVSGRMVRLPLGQVIVGVGLNETMPSNLENSVYPNPATEEATIEVSDLTFENNCEVKLYDAIGKEVSKLEMVNGTCKINLQHFAKGIYTFTVEQNNVAKSRGKLIVN